MHELGEYYTLIGDVGQGREDLYAHRGPQSLGPRRREAQQGRCGERDDEKGRLGGSQELPRSDQKCGRDQCARGQKPGLQGCRHDRQPDRRSSAQQFEGQSGQYRCRPPHRHPCTISVTKPPRPWRISTRRTNGTATPTKSPRADPAIARTSSPTFAMPRHTDLRIKAYEDFFANGGDQHEDAAQYPRRATRRCFNQKAESQISEAKAPRRAAIRPICNAPLRAWRRLMQAGPVHRSRSGTSSAPNE